MLWQSRGMVADVTQDRLAPRTTKASLPMALLRAWEAVMSHFRPVLDRHESVSLLIRFT